MIKKALVSAIALASLAACSSAPLKVLDNPKGVINTQKQALLKGKQLWDEPALEQEGKAMLVLMTPFSLPDSVRDTKVEASFEPNATAQDLTVVLAKLNKSAIIADKAAAEATFYMPYFKGTLGDMLAAISRASDVWFTWQNGVIEISSKQRVALSMPQDEQLAKQIKEGLQQLGIKDSLIAWDAGMLSFDVTPKELERATRYLERITKNSALVSLQVAIITVTLNQSDQSGIDWSQLQLSIGHNSKSIFDQSNANPFAQSSSGTSTGTTGSSTNSSSGSTTNSTGGTSTGTNTGTSTGTGTGTTTGTAAGTTTGATVPDYVNTLLMAGSGARAVISNGAFSLVGLFDFLGNYGNAQTLENVMMKTMTGNKVELKSVTQIPYVTSVGVTTTGGSSSNSSLGSSNTSTANDGVTLDLTPAYDASAQMVSLDFKLDIDAVIGFNNLNAGNQLGTLTQPTTATRSFNDILRLRPGQTAVIGGLTYESVSRNNSAPLFLRGTSLENQQLTMSRNTMFIVVRPTVRVSGSLSAEQPEDLKLAPKAASPDQLHNPQ